MSGLGLFLLLLGMGLVGRWVVSNRDGTRFGLYASGLEYAALGFLLGPQGADVVRLEALEAVAPLAHFAIGWFALLVGLEVGKSGRQELREKYVAAGIGSAVFTLVVVAVATWIVLLFEAPMFEAKARALVAAGAGVVCAETARHVVRKVSPGGGAPPDLAPMEAFAKGDDGVPLVVTAPVFAIAAQQEPTSFGSADCWLKGGVVAPWASALGPFLLGALLGGIVAVHLGRELRVGPTWVVLIGTTLFGVGASIGIGASPLATLFAVGVTVAAATPHGKSLRALVRPLEQDLLLPIFLLAGAHIDLRDLGPFPLIVVVAIGLRVATKLVAGFSFGARTKAPVAMGFALLPSGALTIVVGLAFALRFPGAIGHIVLTVAALSCVLGDIVGPMAVRRLHAVSRSVA